LGNTCNVKKLSDYEFYISLEKKLKEEIQEYQQSKSVEELTNILEVKCRISQLNGTNIERLGGVLKRKNTKEWSF
jgi:predicted house-cleaning noncanonical NTP pyrophosphatase (MazG superfamily)